MSSADELLQMTADVGVEHIHSVTDNDSYFVIDPETRLVSNLSGTGNVVMQYDHLSERYTFQLPRIVEGHDMMLCNRVRVHYDNVGPTEYDRYASYDEIYDLRINPEDSETVICSWLIPRDATQFPGMLSILVQYLCVDDDGVEQYEWHSDIYENITVKKGKRNGEGIPVEYNNLLEQWRTQLFGIGDTAEADILAASQAQQDEIEAKGEATLETIPDDYTGVYNLASNAARNKAEAIVLSDSGDHICLDDSANSYLLGLNLMGKTAQVKTNGYQVFDASLLGSKTTSGATVTCNGDGSYTISGTGTLSGNFAHTVVLYGDDARAYVNEAGTYRLKFNGPSAASRSVPYFHFRFGNGANVELEVSTNEGYVNLTDEVINSAGFYVRFGFWGNSGAEIVPMTIWPMVYKDGDGAWEPYTGGRPGPNEDYPLPLNNVVNPKIGIHGKNLIQYSKDSHSSNGITQTLNLDGSVTVNGTSTGESYYLIDQNNDIPVYDTDLIASCEGLNGEFPVVIGYIKSDNSFVNAIVNCLGPEVRFRYPKEAVKTRTFIAIGSGRTFSNKIVKPMIRLADADSDFDNSRSVQDISITRTLNGVPVSSGGNYTDDNGQQWICDEVDFERGKYIQRIGVKTLNGTEDTLREHGSNQNTFMINWTDVDGGWAARKGLCSHFINNENHAYAGDSGYFACDNKGYMYFGFDSTSLDDFRNWLMSNTPTLMIPLVTPIETDLTPAELAEFKMVMTNSTNTTFVTASNAGMGVKYVADIERFIQKNCTTKVKQFDITLPLANWAESADRTFYMQTISFVARPNSRIDLFPTPAQLISLINDGLSMFAANDDGVVTVYSIGGIPGTDVIIRATETVVIYE